MNRKYIRYNFEEIQEEVEILMRKLKSDKELSHAEYYSGVQHIYHHLNIAWNARHTEQGQVPDLDDPRMEEWSQYPKDLTLI